LLGCLIEAARAQVGQRDVLEDVFMTNRLIIFINCFSSPHTTGTGKKAALL